MFGFKVLEVTSSLGSRYTHWFLNCFFNLWKLWKLLVSYQWFIELLLFVEFLNLLKGLLDFVIMLHFSFLNTLSYDRVAQRLIFEYSHILWFLFISWIWKFIIVFYQEVKALLLTLWEAFYWKLIPFCLFSSLVIL